MQYFGRAVRRPAFIGVTFAMLATLGMSFRSLPDLRLGSLFNPDSYMRLVRLRDMLDSGTVVFTAARDGSGHGTVLHWSHLLDSLLCVIALPFRLFLGPVDSLHAAALIFGPLNIAAAAFAAVWAAAPFAERRFLWLAAILPPLSPSIFGYGMPGVVHHHVAVVIVAIACWGWAARLIARRTETSSAIALGVWAAVGVWLTPETLPLTMMAFGALWFGWIVAPERRDLTRAIAQSGLSFALVTLLAWVVDPPAAGFGAVEADRLSLLFVGLALAVAGAGLGPRSAFALFEGRWGRRAAALLAGVVCCAVWAAVFRDTIFRPDMLLDDEQWAAMFGPIAEMQPVAGVFGVLQFLLTGVWAAVLLIILAVWRRSAVLAYAALCVAGLLVLGWSHLRFAAAPEASGAIALPVALTIAGIATLTWHPAGRSFALMAIALLFIQVPYMGQLPDMIGIPMPSVALSACKIDDAVALLAGHPGAVVLADVSDTPEILYKTNVRTVGSLYHRNIGGFSRLRAAWRVAPSQTVPPEIDAAEISLVLGCLSPARSSLVAEIKTATLLDLVRTGHPPAWLRQIDENPVSGHVLYEVVRPNAPAYSRISSVATDTNR